MSGPGSVFGLGYADLALVSPQVAFLPPKARIVRPEALAARLGIDPSAVAVLSANENPLGPSDRAVEAAIRALTGVHRYPDPDGQELRRALAAHHGVSDEQILIGNGSTQLIELLVRTFVGPGQTVVSGWPTFAAYRLAAQVSGREFLSAPLRRGRIDLAGVAALVDARTKLVFIANPNNPTGTHVGLRELAVFLNRVPPEVLVVVDEAYADFVEAEDYPLAIQDLLPGHPRLVVLRTFSKAYGLAGLRVGYAVTAPVLVRHLELVRPTYSVGSVALAAALAALEDHHHVERSRRLVVRERKRMTDGLRRLGLTVFPSQANFVCADGLPLTAAAALEEAAILVRGLETYDMPNAVRVTIGAPEANVRFLSAAEALLSIA